MLIALTSKDTLKINFTIRRVLINHWTSNFRDYGGGKGQFFFF